MLHEVRSLQVTAAPTGSPAARAGAALLAGPLAGLTPAAPTAPARRLGLAAVVLHAAGTGDVAPLLAWIGAAADQPEAEVVLDTAAGVPLAAGDHLGEDEVAVLERALRRDGDVPAVTAGGVPGVSTVGVSLYDALGRDDVRLLLARLVHLMAPGVPCVSAEALARLDVARPVRTADDDDVAALLRRPVLDAAVRLVRLRQEHPAFGGSFDCGAGTRPTPAGPDDEGAPCGDTAAELRARLGGAADARRRAADPLADVTPSVPAPPGAPELPDAPGAPVSAAWLRWTSGSDQVVLVVEPEQDAFRLAVTTPEGWVCARSVREVRDLAVPVAA
ncbi:MAG: hypothetical protein U0Q15_01200 [Kineosporiaceae bacterium]